MVRRLGTKPGAGLLILLLSIATVMAAPASAVRRMAPTTASTTWGCTNSPNPVTLSSTGDGEFVLECTGLRTTEKVSLSSASLEAACKDADFDGDEGPDVDKADIEGVVHETVELTKCAAGSYTVEVSQKTTPFQTIHVPIQIKT